MKDLNEIISEYMAKRGVKDEHFINPHGWKEIAVLFAKEATKQQRVICSNSASDFGGGIVFRCNKESILNAKSPV